MELSNFVFNSLVLRDDTGFSSLCLDVDVASQGVTADEAKQNLREAVILYIESAIESNLPVIRPVPLSENPSVARANDIVEVFKLNVNIEVNAYV